MKAFVAAFVFVFNFYVSQQTDDADYQALLKTSLAKCSNENEVDLKIVDKIWSDPDFPADNAALKCFYHCMNVQLGITDENENLDDDSIKKLFAHYDKSEKGAIGGNCENIDVSDGDLCDTAYELLKCVSEFQLNK